MSSGQSAPIAAEKETKRFVVNTNNDETMDGGMIFIEKRGPYIEELS